MASKRSFHSAQKLHVCQYGGVHFYSVLEYKDCGQKDSKPRNKTSRQEEAPRGWVDGRLEQRRVNVPSCAPATLLPMEIRRKQPTKTSIVTLLYTFLCCVS